MDDAMAATDGKETDDLSWSWALAGTAMFAIAIAAPLVIVNLSQSLRDAPEPTQVAKIEAPESSAREAEDTLKTDPPLESAFETATISPGVGIGKVSLGQPVASVLDQLTERFQASFGHDENGVVQHHSFHLGNVEVRLDSRPDEGRIESIRLYAANCQDLAQNQPRQEGLPVTADGLTIGSHQSRVIHRMGVPIKGRPIAPIPGPMRQPSRQVFEGLTFDYCQDSQLVKAVIVNRSDGLRHNIDLMAAALPNSQASAPVHPMVLTAPARVNNTSAVSMTSKPLTVAPQLSFVPELVAEPPSVTSPTQPNLAPSPADFSQDFTGLDAVSMIALAPVVDLPVKPNHQNPSLTSLIASDESGAVARLASNTLSSPDTIDQAAIVKLRTDPDTQYSTAAPTLALAPSFSGAADRGLLNTDAETGPPVLARGLERPLGDATPGALHANPSALALWDTTGDQIAPLAAVKPGASLPLTRSHKNASLPAAPAGDVHRPEYQSTANEQLFVASVDQLVDPGDAPSAVNQPAPPSEMAGALAEADLGLNRTTRRSLQRRLSLIGYDPAGIDGIFGPKTRTAIAALQADADLEPTGFLTAKVKEMIEARSRQPYAEWRKAELRRLAKLRRLAQSRPTAAAPVKVARIPSARRIPECQRGEDGQIASNQSFKCDVDLLQESLQELFNFRS